MHRTHTVCRVDCYRGSHFGSKSLAPHRCFLEYSSRFRSKRVQVQILSLFAQRTGSSLLNWALINCINWTRIYCMNGIEKVEAFSTRMWFFFFFLQMYFFSTQFDLSLTRKQTFVSPIKTALLESTFRGEDFQKTPFFCFACAQETGVFVFVGRHLLCTVFVFATLYP